MRRAVALALVAGCGVTTVEQTQGIVGGTPDDGDEAVVAIVERPVCQDAFTIECSGMLVAPQVVLTAAHCVSPGTLPEVHVGSPVGSGRFIAVAQAIRHPAFDDTTHAFDLAVLLLAEPAEIAPVALPTATLDASFVGASVRVVGFGVEATGALADGMRRSGTMQISAIDAYTFTATPAPSNTCGGDSGGPVFTMVGADEQLLGVTVSGDPTCMVNAVDGRVDISVADFVRPHVDAPPPGAPPAGPSCGDDGCSAGGGASVWVALLLVGCRSRRRTPAGSTRARA